MATPQKYKVETLVLDDAAHLENFLNDRYRERWTLLQFVDMRGAGVMAVFESRPRTALDDLKDEYFPEED